MRRWPCCARCLPAGASAGSKPGESAPTIWANIASRDWRAAATSFLLLPPPNFKSLIETASNAVPAEGSGQLGEQECLPHTAENCPSGKPLITSYMTTYYPGVKDRAQAASVQLRAGEDLPANFSLAPSPSVAIRGLVGNIPANASVTVVLRSTDFNSILNGGEVRKDGSFEICDVSPGPYTLLAAVTGATPVPLMARQTLEVGAENLIGLRLILQAGGEIRGRLRVEGKSNGAK